MERLKPQEVDAAKNAREASSSRRRYGIKGAVERTEIRSAPQGACSVRQILTAADRPEDGVALGAG